MKRRLSQNSARDSDGVRAKTFDNDGQYTYSTISQGNTYNVGGNLYTTASSRSEIELDTGKQDTTQLRERLLKSLYFQEMNYRQEYVQSLIDDFGLTCQWILTPGKDHGFLSWCKEDGRLFWISGLPGTGKSTLIDFLDQELPSIDFLAGTGTILRHFFSSADGSVTLQKSLDGLFRALCHQILSERGDLVDQLVQNASSLSFLRHLRTNLADVLLPKWTTRALRSLFNYLVEHAACRYILLLDGLDECGDDHEDLLQTISTFLSLGTKIRIICSSRPDEPFRSALKDHVMIKLQDVNANDISKFCERTLRGSRAHEFVPDIVRMSEGIFLWAAIVTLDLRRESRVLEIDELENRLEQCPSDMSKLYQHMLDRQRDSLRLGQSLPPYLPIFDSWTQVSKDIARPDTALLVLFAIGLLLQRDPEDFGQFLQLSCLESCREKVELIEGQVLTSCAGLVRVVDRSELRDLDLDLVTDSEETLSDSSCSEDESCNSIGQQRTNFQRGDEEVSTWDATKIAEMLTQRRFIFVHKTASEFLHDKEIERQLWAKCSISKADIMVAITKALIADPSNWQHDLLAFDIEIRDRFRRLRHCASCLENDIQYCNKFYALVSCLLRTPFYEPPAGLEMTRQMNILLNYRLIGDTCVYNHSLSHSENVVCNWIARNLDSAAFLEYNRSSKFRKIEFAACIASCHWANTSEIKTGEMRRLLSSQDLLLKKCFAISTVRSGHPVLVHHSAPEEMTLWPKFIGAWLSNLAWRRVNGFRYSLPFESYHESLACFMESDQNSVDKIRMNMRIVLIGRELHDLSVTPKCNGEQFLLSKTHDKVYYWEAESLIIEFEMRVCPKCILPAKFSEQLSQVCEDHTEDRPVQLMTLGFQGTEEKAQLSVGESKALCDIIGLGRHCLNPLDISSLEKFDLLDGGLAQFLTDLAMTHRSKFDKAVQARLMLRDQYKDGSAESGL